MADPVPRMLWLTILLLVVAPAPKARAEPDYTQRLPVASSTLTELKQNVRADPVSAEKRFLLGVAELQSGDYFSAERELSLARQRGYQSDLVVTGLAQSLLHLGRYEDVLSQVKPCADDRRCAAVVRAAQARAMLHLNIVDEAGRQIQIASKEGPDLLEPKLAEAEFLLVQKDPNQAEKVIDAVLAGKEAVGDPAWSDALVLKGDLRRRTGDFAGAEHWYRRMLSHYPASSTTSSRLSLCLLAQDRIIEAQAEIAPQLQLASPNLFPLYLGALASSGNGDMPAALALLRSNERQFGEVAQGSLLLAILHAGNGNLEEAVTYANHFHLVKADDLSAVLLLARLQFDLGDYNKVIALLSAVAKQVEQRPEALALIGASQLAMGQNHAAVEKLAAAQRLAPQDKIIEARLALAQSRVVADRAEGLRTLEELTRQDPADKVIGLVLFSIYLELAQPAQAAAVAERMIAARPTDPLPLCLRGAIAFQRGDRAAAERDFAAANQRDGKFLPAQLYLAEIYIEDGRTDLAQSLIRPALKRNPFDLGFLFADSALKKRLGDNDGANADLDRAISLQGDNVVARGQLLQGLIALKEFDRAARVAKGMADHWASDATSLDIAARALLQVGQADRALPLLQTIQSGLRASLDSWLQLGRAYQAANRPDLARAAYDRALAIDPALQRAIAGRVDVELQSKGAAAAAALAHSLLGASADGSVALSCGQALARDRRYAAAVIFYQIAGEHHAGAASLQALALAKLRLDDRAGLSRQISDWLAKNPDSPELRAVLAETLMRDQDWREAAHQWSLVLAKQPGNAMAANNLAWLYGKLQDPRALDYAERALLAAPDQPQIKDTYGVLLLASGQRGRAGELLRQAMQAAPDSPEVSFHFAQYLAESDREAARKLLQTLIERNIAFDEADQARQLYQRLSNGG